MVTERFGDILCGYGGRLREGRGRSDLVKWAYCRHALLSVCLLQSVKCLEFFRIDFYTFLPLGRVVQRCHVDRDGRTIIKVFTSETVAAVCEAGGCFRLAGCLFSPQFCAVDSCVVGLNLGQSIQRMLLP